MGIFSNWIENESLKPGDHIYTWRAAYIYSHHGIYVGDNKVIHFTRPDQEVGSRTVVNVLPASSCLTLPLIPCLTCVPPDKEGHGVLLSCLDCFLAGGKLYRFEYNVTHTHFVAKIRGGSCSLAKSDSWETVVHRAQFLLDNGFGCYDVFKNNCEDFAIYCKTGLVVDDEVAMGKSGQASSFAGGPLAAISSLSLRFLSSNPYGMAAMGAGVYCTNRLAADVGMRTDVVKLEVEDLVKRLELSMQAASEGLKVNASQLGDKVDEERRFVQAVDGINKKGTVYGHVKKSTTYYPEKSSDDLSSISTPYTPSVVSEMEARLRKTEDELQATREMLRATQEEQKEQRELIARLISRSEGSS